MRAVEEKKVPLSLKVSPELKAQLLQFAKKEKRPVGNLGELLLEWAFERLLQAKTTMALLGEVVVPSSHSPQQHGQGKDELLDERVRLSDDIIHGPQGREKGKARRSKAS